MKLTELAAYRVVERGLDYYLNDAVSDVMKTGTSVFEGKVIGGREEPYIVRVNLEKPRSSRCTCPYATGQGCMLSLLKEKGAKYTVRQRFM